MSIVLLYAVSYFIELWFSSVNVLFYILFDVYKSMAAKISKINKNIITIIYCLGSCVNNVC